eukprot:scaffold117575_cov32-Tisochrysis_lutea.AAC.2
MPPFICCATRPPRPSSAKKPPTTSKSVAKSVAVTIQLDSHTTRLVTPKRRARADHPIRKYGATRRSTIAELMNQMVKT